MVYGDHTQQEAELGSRLHPRSSGLKHSCSFLLICVIPLGDKDPIVTLNIHKDIIDIVNFLKQFMVMNIACCLPYAQFGNIGNLRQARSIY